MRPRNIVIIALVLPLVILLGLVVWKVFFDNLSSVENANENINEPTETDNLTRENDISEGYEFINEDSIVDETPPAAITQSITLSMGEAFTAESFVVEITHKSEIISIEFVSEPDLFKLGDQNVEIIITDELGNYAVFEAMLTLLPVEIPPRFEGIRDITAAKDAPIMFRQGVSAFDAFNRPIDFDIDSSGVDYTTLGVYSAIYSAVDEWGLKTEREITVTITSIDPEEVRQRVNAILDNILRDGMTQVQQARVIFDWIVQNVEFAAGIGQDNVYEAANQALQHRRGHCFVFYGISEIMLTEAGIPNMRIERIPGTPTRHRWNLINPDDMGWHHFDTNQAYVGSDRYMFTDSHAKWLTAVIAETVGIVEYYTYNPELYPKIVE